MTDKKKVLAISGSIRESSTNLRFIMAISGLFTSAWEFEIYKGLAALPHFNPDLSEKNIPDQVLEFRKKLIEADGIRFAF
jgi:NAD(P)H-dependent FMN reductase